MTNVLSLQGLPLKSEGNPHGVMTSTYTVSACSSASTYC